jgi:hypothetical protein
MAIEQLRWRVRAAVLISLVINSLFVVIILATGTPQITPTKTQRIVAALTAPSTALGEWSAPRGHDGIHFVGGAVIAVVSSVLFYAIVAWFLLSLPVWWRERQ